MSEPSEIQLAYNKLMESMEGMAKDAKGWKVSDISAVTGMTSAIRSLRADNKLMQARIDELVFSLDDRDCYIADDDMKNAILTARIAELERVIKSTIGVINSSPAIIDTVWMNDFTTLSDALEIVLGGDL